MLDGGIASRGVVGRVVSRKLDNRESCSGNISIASFLNADLHLPRNVFFVSPMDEARVLIKC